MVIVERGTEQTYSLKAWRCFACDKYAVGQPKIATCADDQTVHVGPCCFRKIKKGGADGYQPSIGGPRLYTVENKPSGE